MDNVEQTVAGILNAPQGRAARGHARISNCKNDRHVVRAEARRITGSRQSAESLEPGGDVLAGWLRVVNEADDLDGIPVVVVKVVENLPTQITRAEDGGPFFGGHGLTPPRGSVEGSKGAMTTQVSEDRIRVRVELDDRFWSDVNFKLFFQFKDKLDMPQ